MTSSPTMASVHHVGCLHDPCSCDELNLADRVRHVTLALDVVVPDGTNLDHLGDRLLEYLEFFPLEMKVDGMSVAPTSP